MKQERTRVKICGITSVDEGRLAEKYGADAIGFLVGRRHQAADFIEPERVNEICSKLGPFVATVLVTHLEEPREIIRLAEGLACTVIQLHSDLPREQLSLVRRRIWPKKVLGKISVENDAAIERAREIEQAVDGIVLDSIDRATDRVGGTGVTHDWALSAKIAAGSRIPVVLAGGLTPENVAQALGTVRPWAVDVNSGVETSDGQKSEDRIRRFIEAVRMAS